MHVCATERDLFPRTQNQNQHLHLRCGLCDSRANQARGCAAGSRKDVEDASPGHSVGTASGPSMKCPPVISLTLDIKTREQVERAGT